MINGEYKIFQNIVELNAGVAIYLSGLVNNIKEGFILAKKVIDDGTTKNFLNTIINE